MKRKMLISIALIMVMLLNCVMPIFVNAAQDEEIRLNSKLYFAVKSSLLTQQISFNADDITHTITLSDSVKSSIKELNLNESSISDLSGLEAFTELTHLELSGNNLTRQSNLNVLNSFSKLNYLDLSTNQLEDVSEIRNLINRLQSSGTIILSGQSVTIVDKYFVNTEEDSDEVEKITFELPGILELAGYIKSCWKITNSIPETENAIAPSLNANSVPMYVTPENNKIEVNVCSETGNPYLGLLEFTVYIHDDATEAASAKNPNKAAENILNGSEFKLYYIIHAKETEAVTTMDTNLYNAIKEQLTAGQTKNPYLNSYTYSVDKNGDIIYENYTYRTQGNYRILRNVETNEEKYAYDNSLKVLRTYKNGSIGDVVNTIVEPKVIAIVDDNGNITSKSGYEIAFIGEDSNQTLYVQAYDKAKTFIIDDGVLTNKITSLVLNNEQIKDLSGIEDFVGLTSKLNVSHNYLKNIEPIYYIDGQKDYWESQIIDKYTQYLKTRKYGNLADTAKETKLAKEEIDKNAELITNTYNQIIALLADAADTDVSLEESKVDEALKIKANSINEALDKIYGYTDEEGNYHAGYIDLIEGYADTNGKHIDGNVEKLTENISKMYSYLKQLYVLYNDEYKLTSLLVPSINYRTTTEFEEYDKKISESAESAKSLVEEEVNFLKTLETEKGLSDLDKELLGKAFGIDFSNEKVKAPLGEFFDKYLKENALSRTQSVRLINIFREINLYSEMANYCLIKRMNEDTASSYCYEEEYLENRIKELEIEDLPREIEEKILEKIKNNIKESDTLYGTYEKYTEKEYSYGLEKVNTCKGEYKELSSIAVSTTKCEKAELISAAIEASKSGQSNANKTSNLNSVLGKIGNRANSIIKTIDLYEKIKNNTLSGEKNQLFLSNQMSSLTSKLLNGDIDRYVKLPKLKELNVSYNADLEDIDRISELKSLYNLNASYCYIEDIANINWADMPSLKNLSLAYNYISNITSITNLANLKSLDLSNNLISGKLNISEEQYIKLFKKMENFNLSGNKITDIESLLIYLDYISGGNYANYLARKDTININLNNQNIDLVIDDPIDLETHPRTIDVELPSIFTQLLAIDISRTGFGETSQNGRIESEGKYVTLNTRTEGDKIGRVVVLPMNGNGQEVETCVGNGTTATIRYTVKATSPDNPGNVVIPGNNTTKPDNNTTKPDNNTTKPDNNTTKPEENTTKPNNNTSNPGDTTKVIDTTKLGYKVGEEYLTGVAAKTPVADFKTILLNGLTYNVEVTKDSAVVTSGYIATGMYVKIVDDNGDVLKDQNGNLVVYQIVVKGDVNGDGVADALDSNLIKAYRVEVADLVGANFEAADINSDGKIDVSDSKLLLYHRAEVNGYDLNYSKQ